MYIHQYLAKARQDDLMRAAAQRRLSAEATRARRPQRRHTIAAPAPRLALTRLRVQGLSRITTV
jgi:hypothetical protein